MGVEDRAARDLANCSTTVGLAGVKGRRCLATGDESEAVRSRGRFCLYLLIMSVGVWRTMASEGGGFGLLVSAPPIAPTLMLLPADVTEPVKSCSGVTLSGASA